ncbi:MAG: hypothetical protein ACE5HS_10790 [bacterium]
MNVKLLTCRKVKQIKKENNKLRGTLEVILCELEKNNIEQAKELAHNALRSESRLQKVRFTQDWLAQILHNPDLTRGEWGFPSESVNH